MARTLLGEQLLITLSRHPEFHQGGLHGWKLADLAGLGDANPADLNGALRLLRKDELIHRIRMEGSNVADVRGATFQFIRLTTRGRQEAERLQESHQPPWKKAAIWTIRTAGAAAIGAAIALLVERLI